MASYSWGFSIITPALSIGFTDILMFFQKIRFFSGVYINGGLPLSVDLKLNPNV